MELYLDATMDAERPRKMTTTSADASPRWSLDTQARLRACLGAACALLAWLALGELTGVGKTPSLL